MDHANSWYAATRDPAPDRPPLAAKVECDVAIVGGGYAGLHTARLLAMRGKKVVLVERHRVGWGASGRNGGFVGPGYAERTDAIVNKIGPDQTRALYRLSQEGVEIVRDAIRDAGRPDLVMGKGKLTVTRVNRPKHYPHVARQMQRELGAHLFPWETGEVRAVLVTKRYFQALCSPDSFHIHPLNLALALAADIVKRGGAVHEDTAAVGLKRQGDMWRVSTKSTRATGEIAARHVVLAGNAQLGRIRRRIASSVQPDRDLRRRNREARAEAQGRRALARRHLRHAPCRQLLSRGRWRSPAVGRRHHDQHDRAQARCASACVATFCRSIRSSAT